MADLLGISTSGLLSNQRALTTAGHNIANVNTEGYSRQRVIMSTRTPSPSGAGYYGNGVHITSVDRIFNQFNMDQVNTYTTTTSELDIYHSLASQVDNMLANPEAGLSPVVQDFFGAVQGVADDPASIPARQVLISNGEALVDRFGYLDQRLEDLSEQVNGEISFLVDEVNSVAAQIAKINERILLASGAGTGAAPNDLLDQRDLLITRLAENISVTTTVQDDGQLNVFIGNGQPLVVANSAASLSVTRNQFNPGQSEITFSGSAGTSIITDSLTGGKLSGVVDFNKNMLEPARNALGRLAIGIADSFNQQHQLGQDLNGVLGGNFFADPTSTIPEAFASINNSGTGVMAAVITDIGALQVSDYQLNYDGANYTLTRLSDNTATVFAGLPIDVTATDGFTISLSAGAVNAGDSFLIRPTYQGASGIDMALSNPAEVAAAAPIIAQAGFANIGNSTISAGYVDSATQPPVDVNLQQPVTITFTGPGTFDVVGVGTGNPVGVAYTPGANISYNGWVMQIDGAPAAGDTFTVGPNTDGVGDNRNALSLADLENQNILIGGTANFQATYGQVIAEVGVKTHQAEVNLNAQSILLEQSIAVHTSVSGVNLDEEAANLIKYQQAYQASGQVVAIANQLFQDLLFAMR